MGISRMQKVLIAIHQSEKSMLIENLQSQSLLHIKDVRESSLGKDNPDLLAQEEVTDKELEARLLTLNRAIDYLGRFAGAASFLEAFIPQKVAVSEKAYEQATASPEVMELAGESEKCERRLSDIDRERGLLTSQKETLLPWQALDENVESIVPSRSAILMAGIITNPPTDWEEQVKESDLDIEIVNQELHQFYVLISYVPEDEESIKKLFSEIGFEAVSFEGFKGRPADIISQLEKKLHSLDEERQSILERSKEYAEQLQSFFILYDHYFNELSQRQVDNFALATDKAFFIEGWVRAKDYKVLDKLVSRFATAGLSKATPEPGESPPVELENRKGMQIFESITDLYGAPNAQELDPSPFLAPFFVIFFALCLTDACYGAIFAIISLVFMKKLKGDKRLLKVLFASSIATIFVGALTGGWFGDFTVLFPGKFQGFINFKNRILILDPLKNPLPFFVLALALGFVQIMLGYFLGFIKAVRQGKIMEGISSKLSWVLFWVSFPLGGFFLSKAMSQKPAGMVTLKETIFYLFSGQNPFQVQFISLFSVTLISSGLILFVSGGVSRNWMTRIAKGAFNLYQGGMGTVGDIISYSRLFALGLVTVGLAVSINILVGVVKDFPVIGIVLAPLLFIVGHVFSVGINVLGAYVHTLRLQYAEFFTKFFDGGGVPFSPFRKEAKYIVVQK